MCGCMHMYQWSGTQSWKRCGQCDMFANAARLHCWPDRCLACDVCVSEANSRPGLVSRAGLVSSTAHTRHRQLVFTVRQSLENLLVHHQIVRRRTLANLHKIHCIQRLEAPEPLDPYLEPEISRKGGTKRPLNHHFVCGGDRKRDTSLQTSDTDDLVMKSCMVEALPFTWTCCLVRSREWTAQSCPVGEKLQICELSVQALKVLEFCKFELNFEVELIFAGTRLGTRELLLLESAEQSPAHVTGLPYIGALLLPDLWCCLVSRVPLACLIC